MAEDDAYYAEGPMVSVRKAACVAAWCAEAGRPSEVHRFLLGNYSLAEVRQILDTPAAAAPATPAAGAQLSVDDRLAAAIKRRFEQQETGKVD